MIVTPWGQSPSHHDPAIQSSRSELLERQIAGHFEGGGTLIEEVGFAADSLLEGGALCGPYSRRPPYSSLKRSPTLLRSGALKEGRTELSSVGYRELVQRLA